MEIKRNSEHNGIELYFEGKPAAAIIAGLKERRFKWHSVKKCWYAVATAENVAFADTLTDDGQTSASITTRATAGKIARSAPVLNKYGVRVGDLFVSSWGYEQTNLNFFQVVALVGSQSVRIREVTPKIQKEENEGGMSRYIRCSIPGPGEMLPVLTRSQFVNDQGRGDVKRIHDGINGGDVYFKVGEGGYLCYKYDGGQLYESWYA